MTDDAPGLNAPGLYFLSDPPESASATLEEIGPFHAKATSHLASHARRDGWHLYFDGVLTSGRSSGQSDAETALQRFLEGDRSFDVLHALEGFYNVLLLHPARPEAYLFSDPLCTRPWYVYRRGATVAAAPTPLAFADWGLPMSLSRDGLYDTFHALHTANGRTLVNEVQRVQPGQFYRAEGNGAFEARAYRSFSYRPDDTVGVEEAADQIKGVLQSAVGGVLRHPRLRSKPVHLPLTGGMDSRQLLGELLAQERPPAALRHVRFREKDYRPAERIAQGLDLPMRAVPVSALDGPRLVERWARRSGGLVNVHQFYLLHLMTETPPGGAVGFTGYLMDLLLSLSSQRFIVSMTDPARAVWERRYTGPAMMRLLLPDARRLAARSLQRLRRGAAAFDGPPWFRLILLDLHRRGLHYTGILDPMLADEAFYFAPGAHAQALRFLETTPFEVGGDRRARLRAMQKYYPDVAAFPDSYGQSYLGRRVFRKPPGDGPWDDAKDMLRAVATGFRHDPAPETEHAWLRRIPYLHHMHRTAAHDSALVHDGHVRGLGAQASWGLLRAGGYQAWTLMSLLTAEVAYRLLVRQEPLSGVLGWLFEDGGRRTVDG